jgi:urease accessory protein
MTEQRRALLRLLHIADSALPIGAAAHSFGLETLVQERDVQPAGLAAFCREWLAETGTLEAYFCRRGYRLGGAAAEAGQFRREWQSLSRTLSALRPARESRAASHALGARFLRLLHDLAPHPLLLAAFQHDPAPAPHSDQHYCAAFGLGAALLALDEESAVLAYLRQALAGFISAGQRLMPVGQGQAGQIQWQLQDGLEQAAAQSGHLADQAGVLPSTFSPLLDVGSMRHPRLAVRLFVS